jgi:hypothetical protein
VADLKDTYELKGKIERKLSGEICINGIRVSSLLNLHLGEECEIIITSPTSTR